MSESSGYYHYQLFDRLDDYLLPVDNKELDRFNERQKKQKIIESE